MEWRFWELLFPPKCIFCGKLLTFRNGLEICSSCYTRIPFNTSRLSLYNDSGSSTIYYDEIVCAAEYSGLVKRSLVRYKFMEKPSYCRAFARLLANKLEQVTECQSFDMITSVPLHWKKKRERGYNQALLLSRQVSRLLKRPECSHLLKRCRETASQSLLKKKDRQSNVKGAFIAVNPAAIAGKSILLIDDVMTTGSTVNECCRVLKAAGAKRVTVAVIASGRRQE